MADFSDEEDLTLYRLAKTQVDAGRRIQWRTVWLGMASCGKTQKQLQIRLKTMKKTYGTSLDSFPKRFRNQEVACNASVERKSTSKPLTFNIHEAISAIFASAPRQPVRTPDCHSGEITPASISAILSEIPTLHGMDGFVDFGSGIGNVVAQVALETKVGRCIGVEFQENLVALSKKLIVDARVQYAALDKVSIYNADIRALSPEVYADAAGCSVLYANSLVFDPTSITSLEDFLTSSEALTNVVLTAKLCGRHRETCQRDFCKMWSLEKTIYVRVSWSAQSQQAYLYAKP